MSLLIDVARLANVSITTASRVLNGNPHPVSEDKRMRVLQAAQSLNYSPSALAKAMVSGFSHIVGVIVGDATDPYFAQIVRGVEDMARAHGYLVIVCNSDRNPAVEISYLTALNDYRVDGVIFAGGGLNDDQYLAAMNKVVKIFQERNAFCISLGKHLFPSFAVVVDNKQIVRSAVNYLISLGHKRIAYISGPELLTTTGLRLDGYREELLEHKIKLDELLILRGNYRVDSGYQAADRVHTLVDKPTAILASNDIMAVGCMSRLKELNYRIPNDISVMGIDDIPFAQIVDPPLTTISLPMYDLGKVGMESLVKLHEGEMLDKNGIVLPHKLIVRKSTGQPRR
jgi:DNA-binding LacI/PurR family transcriptional regulator